MTIERIDISLIDPDKLDYTAGPGYSETTRHVEIEPDRMAWGLATNEIYEGRFKRSTPWMVQNGRILYFEPVKIKPNEDPQEIKTEKDLREYGIVTVKEISTEDLAREQISDDVADVLNIFKRVEDNLPDFSRIAASAFRDVKGLSRFYHQWSREEAEHSNVAELILLATGKRTQEQLNNDYYQTQENTWEIPFEGDIENIIYPYLQERNTNGNYNALADIMMQQGALKCAYAIRKVASDEAMHGASYKEYAEEYAKLHPQEAAQAALRVAWNFRMPSLHLMRHRIKDTIRVVRTIGYNQEEIEKFLRKALNDLSFVPKHLIEKVVSGYWAAESARIRSLMRQPSSKPPLINP